MPRTLAPAPAPAPGNSIPGAPGSAPARPAVSVATPRAQAGATFTRPAPGPVAIEAKLKPKPRPMIDQLWDRYRKTPTDASREALVEYYMDRHVRKIADRLHAQLPGQVDVDDLMQEGYLGLMDSIERFEPERQIKFETFSGRRIFGAMRDYLRHLDPVPRLARRRERTLQNVIESHRKAHGRDPDEDAIRQALELPAPRFLALMSHGRPPVFVNGHGTGGGSGGGAEGVDGFDGDVLPGIEDHATPRPDVRAAHEDLKRWVTRGFCRRDRLIIILYYYERMTMREIGHTLGISESRVSQLLDEIVQTLKGRLTRSGGELAFAMDR